MDLVATGCGDGSHSFGCIRQRGLEPVAGSVLFPDPAPKKCCALRTPRHALWTSHIHYGTLVQNLCPRSWLVSRSLKVSGYFGRAAAGPTGYALCKGNLGIAASLGQPQGKKINQHREPLHRKTLGLGLSGGSSHRSVTTHRSSVSVSRPWDDKHSLTACVVLSDDARHQAALNVPIAIPPAPRRHSLDVAATERSVVTDTFFCDTTDQSCCPSRILLA